MITRTQIIARLTEKLFIIDFADAVKLAEKCFVGLLLHDFGYNIICCNLGRIDGITSLAVLKERLYTTIRNNKGWESDEQ